MTRKDKVIDRIICGHADADIRFQDLIAVLSSLGFEMRVKGSHHIFSRPEIVEILNLQPRGSKAKPYQVKQVREILTSYGLVRQEKEQEEME